MWVGQGGSGYIRIHKIVLWGFFVDVIFKIVIVWGNKHIFGTFLFRSQINIYLLMHVEMLSKLCIESVSVCVLC